MDDKAKELIVKAEQEIARNKKALAEDYYRLQFHLTPPAGLLNDPNGFIQYKGKYHVFYQWNPFETKHGRKFWGHYSSEDLAVWEHEPIALTPSDWYDKDGCYSGSAIEHDGKLIVFYTGNVKDEAGNRETYQCLAVSEDGLNFKKAGPVVHLPEEYTPHFRDPKVWEYEGKWYMVVGAQAKDLTGKAALLSSSDLETWENHGSVAGSNINGLGNFGYMWECPDMFRLQDQDVLIVSPQGLEPEEHLYNNLYQSGYFTGNLDYSNLTYKHGEFTELDRGFDFYAPQTTMDEKGRRLLIAWMGMPEKEEGQHPTLRNNWIHAMTLPRELTLEGGKLRQNPVEELKRLRKNEVSFEKVVINNESVQIDEVSGNPTELILNFNKEITGSFSVNIHNEAVLSYQPETRAFRMERRTFSDKRKYEVRQCYINRLDKLHLFLDTSSLEVFLNNGEEVFTSRIFPDPEDNEIYFSSEKEVIFRLKKWDISSAVK